MSSELPEGLCDHVIVSGYGRVGQNVARFLAEESVPYVVLDMDPARVGDAHAGAQAHALVRDEHRHESPSPDMALRADDVLVLFGDPESLEACEQRLLSGERV